MSKLSEQARDILTQALALSDSDREVLAERLLSSVPESLLGEFPPELVSEWERRARQVADGSVPAVPWDETREQLRQMIHARSDPDRPKS